MTLPRFPISFPDGRLALGIRPGAGTELGRALRGMGLTTGVPTLVLVGAGATTAQLARLGPLLAKVVVPVAVAAGATVIDDGASLGLAGMVGAARREQRGTFPLVGVVPDDDGTSQALDSHHTHFVLVPAHRESEVARWVAAVATAVAGGHRSVALLAAGGDPAFDAVAEHVRAGRIVLAVSRSCGAADHLTAALAGRPSDTRAAALVRSGRVGAVDPSRGASYVADLLRRALGWSDALGPLPT